MEHSTSYGGANWRVLEQAVVGGQHWRAQVSGLQRLTFRQWIEAVKALSRSRNDAAHHADVSLHTFHTFCRLFFGDATTGVGALNGPLLAWQ